MIFTLPVAARMALSSDRYQCRGPHAVRWRGLNTSAPLDADYPKGLYQWRHRTTFHRTTRTYRTKTSKVKRIGGRIHRMPSAWPERAHLESTEATCRRRGILPRGGRT